MDILLVHGLGRTPLSMAFLGRYLEQQGHQIQYFGYAAFAESYDQIVARLRDRIAIISENIKSDCRESQNTPGLNVNTTNEIEHATASYGIVAHSLGGLLVRSALSLVTDLTPPDRLIMLGTPNQSPRAARLAWNLWPFQWFARQCGANLASPQFFKMLPNPHFPYQIIAGTRGWYGLGSPFGTEANDGLVAVTETQISDRDSVLQFPVFHTFMMNDRAVQEAIAQALAPVD